MESRIGGSGNFKQFVLAIKDLKVGQSFLLTTYPSNYRIAVSTSQYLMDVTLSVYQEENGYRIGRTK